MQVAAALAIRCDCGLALADQSIDVTCGRLAQLSKQTAVQLVTPFDGGWQRIGRDVASGWAALQPDDGGGVSPLAFVDGELLQGAPVALRRWLASNPEALALLVGAGALLGAGLLLGGGEPIYPWQLTSLDALGDLLPSVGIALVETVLLLRVLLVGLIEERNYVLARHIRAASMQVLTPPRAIRQRRAGKDGRAVVAVLGLAHLNGVRRLLTTSRAV